MREVIESIELEAEVGMSVPEVVHYAVPAT